MAEDQIARIIQAMRDIANIDLTTAAKVELHIRQQWGGDRIYVGKAPAAKKNFEFRQIEPLGLSLTEASLRLGINRTTLWRLRRRHGWL